MAINFRSFKSDIYTFKIGPAGEEFHVHSLAIARLSNALDRLINGNFREKAAKTIIWEHVSPDTFTRLCEYAYSGAYSCPEPGKAREQDGIVIDTSEAGAEDGVHDEGSNIATPEARALTPERTEDHWGFGPGTGKTAKQKEKKTIWSDSEADTGDEQSATVEVISNLLEGQHLKKTVDGAVIDDTASIEEAFRSQRHELIPLRSAAHFLQVCEAYTNAEAENFEPILLAHAQLYMLGKEKMIENLQVLCFSKIHKILADFTVTAKSVVDIIALARYTYENTDEKDTLRALVTEFLSWRIGDDHIGGREHFLDFLQENGEFTRAFWKLIFWRRV